MSETEVYFILGIIIFSEQLQKTLPTVGTTQQKITIKTYAICETTTEVHCGYYRHQLLERKRKYVFLLLCF